MGTGVAKLQHQYSFYRLATIGWANPLLKQTLPLLGEALEREVLVDLSEVVFMDAFGVTYLAACLERCRTLDAIPKILIRRPKSEKAYKYLLDTGFYESVGISNQAEARRPSKGRVDLVHIEALEPLFVDGLLDFLEGVQPFVSGLKESMRMSFYELMLNFAEHSGSQFGAWASGQRYADRVTLCLLDLGRGIPDSLRTIKKFAPRSDPDLIELSTAEGISAAAGTNQRGLGLTVIRRFVRANRGTMTIISGTGRVRFRPDRKPIRDKIHGNFPGTAVFLSLVPTERGLYVFGDEDETNDANCG